MPTLPLYTPPDVADASYLVLAPGGYEWWHFDAESDCGDFVMVARLGAGFGSDPQYLTRYARYRRRPTRNPPPVPADHPCALSALFERNRLLDGSEDHPGAREYAASGHRLEVRVGPSNCTEAADGSIELRLANARAGLAIDLTYRPLSTRSPHELKPVRHTVAGSEHFWIVAQPLCEVTGHVRLAGATRQLDFHGRGYHDHRFGTAPFGLHVRRSMCGRARFDDRVVAFRIDDCDGSEVPAALAVEADGAGVRELAVAQVARTWPGRAPSEMESPREVRIGLEGREELRLHDARGIDYSVERQHVVFRAVMGTAVGRAVCEMEYHDRPRGY